jgi:prevent-host-death family protein
MRSLIIFEIDMKSLSLTALRQNLFGIVDKVIQTGVPVEIERNGKKVFLVPDEPLKTRLSNLKPRDWIVGDPDELLRIEDLTEWNEPNNL